MDTQRVSYTDKRPNPPQKPLSGRFLTARDKMRDGMGSFPVDCRIAYDIARRSDKEIYRLSLWLNSQPEYHQVREQNKLSGRSDCPVSWVILPFPTEFATPTHKKG